MFSIMKFSSEMVYGKTVLCTPCFDNNQVAPPDLYAFADPVFGVLQNGIRAKVIENWYFQNPDYNHFSYDQNVPYCQADASRVIIIDDDIDVMLDSMFEEIFNEIRAMPRM